MNSSMNVENPSRNMQFAFQLSDSAKLYDDNDVYEDEEPVPDNDFVAPISEPLKLIRDHCICPDGDVVLVVEDDSEKKRITVASIIMRMASKVFTALLCSNFKEGVILAESKRSSSDPVELVLEDDNPEVLLRLCKILHHVRIAPIDTKPQVRDIYELAIVVDKYDCVEAMEAWSGNQLAWWDCEAEWNGGLYRLQKYRLITAAKLFGQPFWFKSFTSWLIFGWEPEDDIGALHKSILADHLSVPDMDALAAQLLPAQLKLTEGVMLLMNAAVTREILGVGIQDLIKKMKRAGIYPLTVKIQKESLTTICSGLRKLGLPASGEDYYHEYNISPGELPTVVGSLDLIRAVVKSYCGGLCLDCVRNGDDPGPGSVSRGGNQASNKNKLQRECRNHPADLGSLLQYDSSYDDESD